MSAAAHILPYIDETTFDPTKTLHFAHANVDGFRVNHELFYDRLDWALNYALASRVLIFAFSETHLHVNDKIPASDLHPLYTYVLGNDRQSRSGGTGLLQPFSE